MNNIPATKKTGGTFLLDSVASVPIFTRENFSEEQREIELMVQNFCTENIVPVSSQIETKDKELSLQLLREMGELGLLSIDVQEKYGGLDLDKTTSILVAETMRYGLSSSFTTTFSVQTGIGMLPIIWFGKNQQKEKYLPKLATGEWIGAYALTEPSAGSDATASKTTAVLNKNRTHYLLNGEKQFITNGGWAHVFTLFAQVDGSRFTTFIVDRDTPGLEIGPEEHKLGVQGSSTVPLKLTDAQVPVENVLGEIGGGATIAFNVLNVGRLKLGASVLGGCKEVITLAAKYALERRQFGQPIAFFDVIKGKIADMTIQTYALDSIVYRTIGMIDQAIGKLDREESDYYLKMGEVTEQFAIESSMVKTVGSESLGICTDTAIQIYGGYGVIEEYPLARLYRDTRIDRIWEGTNEINRQIITGYLMKKSLMNEIPIRESISEIDTFLSSDKPLAPDSPLSNEIQSIETGKRIVLYIFNEALNEFGQDLRHEQQLGELLADSFIDIYMADSTLSRVLQVSENNNQPGILHSIVQTFIAEVSLRLLSRALTGLNDIHHGFLPQEVIDKLRKFQVRMLPKIDIAVLKRQIAEYVYTSEKYPF